MVTQSKETSPRLRENVKEKYEMGCVSARTVLWCLVFWGFAVNYMIRINLNIAIVAMVQPRIGHGHHMAVCEDDTSFNISSNGKESLDNDNDIIEMERYSWDENQQNLILGAFFWLNWLMQLPGGLLAHKYGTKLVFGITNFGATLCCFLIPVASNIHYTAVISVRCLQGMLSGFTWPAMHGLTARWIPPNERSKFVTAYLGSSVGAALTFPLCGYVIHWAGWPLVFYLSGSVGSLWFVMWWMLVYDTPSQHPRISVEEKDYIINSIGKAISQQKEHPPWRYILTSKSLWYTTLAQWGGIWGLFTLMTQAPTYLKYIHGWDIRSTGILSGLPHLLRMTCATVFSQLGDYLLHTNKLSRTNVRKMATAVCCIGQGICTLGLAYVGCDSISAVVLIIAATAANGAVSTGPLASYIDITPNYASVALGFSGMITSIPGFISPAIVGYLTLNNQTVEQWQKVFLISSGWLLSTGFIYVLFADSNLASWNDMESIRAKEETGQEMEVFIKVRGNDRKDIEIEDILLNNTDNDVVHKITNI